MNILAKCTYYAVNLLKLSEKERAKVEETFSIDADCSTLMMSEESINILNLPEESIDYENSEFDQDELEQTLIDYVGKWPFYLIYGNHIRWNGANGYMITDKITDIVLKRDYDCSINIIENPKSNVFIGLESSHDVPTGARITVIGITSEEADKLNDSDFDIIEKFVEKRSK